MVGNLFNVPQDVPLWKAAMSIGMNHSKWVDLAAFFVRLMLMSSDSDVVYLSFFGADNIILNSNEAISDLLDKRSAIYFDRVRPSDVSALRSLNYVELQPHFPMVEL